MQTVSTGPRRVIVLRWIVRGWSVLVWLLAIMIGSAPEAHTQLGKVANVPLIEAIALGGYGLAVPGLIIVWGTETWGGAVFSVPALLYWVCCSRSQQIIKV